MEQMHYHLHAINGIIFITVKRNKTVFFVHFQHDGMISTATAAIGKTSVNS